MLNVCVDVVCSDVAWDYPAIAGSGLFHVSGLRLCRRTHHCHTQGMYLPMAPPHDPSAYTPSLAFVPFVCVCMQTLSQLVKSANRDEEENCASCIVQVTQNDIPYPQA